MTPAQLKKARAQLGISAETLAKTVGVSSGRVVRRWEAGENPIPGAVVLVLRYWLKTGIHPDEVR